MTGRMTAAEKQELVRSITALVKCNVLQKEDYNALMRVILNACNRTLKSIDDPYEGYPCRECDLITRSSCAGCPKETEWRAKHPDNEALTQDEYAEMCLHFLKSEFKKAINNYADDAFDKTSALESLEDSVFQVLRKKGNAGYKR